MFVCVVPCEKRVKDIEVGGGEVLDGIEKIASEAADMEDSDWDSSLAMLQTPNRGNKDTGEDNDDEIEEIKEDEGDISSDSEAPDIETFVHDDNLIEEDADPAAYNNLENENILKFRTYDLYITYDKYYQTPRLWICGYDEV